MHPEIDMPGDASLTVPANERLTRPSSSVLYRLGSNKIVVNASTGAVISAIWRAPCFRHYRRSPQSAPTLFVGAAVFISVVEHPARMERDTRAATTQSAPIWMRGRAEVLNGCSTHRTPHAFFIRLTSV